MSRDPDKAFFGHPAGLSTLFFTEMWERFSYYGMRAFLVLYLFTPVSRGGKGMFDINEKGELVADASAGMIVGMFGAAVYLLALPGGWIADRFLGQRKSVTIGGIGIALGNTILAIPALDDFFYAGLICIALGTGFLKPNISTIVGQLYAAGDTRRDSGYTIYYMGINIGATAAPLICGYFAQDADFRALLASKGFDPNICWNVAFGAAAVGMVGGLIQYTLGQKRLGSAGLKPTIPTDKVKAARDVRVLQAIGGALVAIAVAVVVLKPSKDQIADAMGIGLILGSFALFGGLFKSARDDGERRRIIAMIPLYIGAIGFFGIFEQAPTTLNTYAEELVQREFLGIEIPASYYQSVNGFFIVALAPVFAAIWLKLAKVGKEPTSVNKFGIGMLVLAVAFIFMLPASDATSTNRANPGFLIGLYFFNTVAELCISPVGLSSMSKLAPQRLAGLVMGTWFLGTAIGIYLAGRASQISSGKGYDYLFKFLIVASLVMAALLFVVAPKIKKIMGAAAKDHDPADKSEKAEPEPLPSARVVDKKDD
jgi:POT family proton-dependent oligopeptide transporter